MSSYKILTLIIISLYISGCSIETSGNIKYQFEKRVKKDYKKNSMETGLILYALEYEKNKNYNQAMITFIDLFKIDRNYEYLNRVISNAINSNNLNIAKKFIKVSENEFNKSQNKLLASILLQEQKYSEVIEVLNVEYKKSKDKTILLDMSKILIYKLNRVDDAIKYLENHILLYEFDKELSKLLIKSLSNSINNSQLYTTNNIYKIVDMLEKLYLTSNDIEYLNDSIRILINIKDSNKAIKLLYKYRVYDEILLELLKIEKRYKEGSNIAKSIYKNTDDLNFLALEAIFYFESLDDNKSINNIEEVVIKLKKVLEEIDNSAYQNYLGYILIDYDLNYKEGIEYVKKALQNEPNSNYYLDSLAWGYYKLNKCKKALALIEQINRSGLNDDLVFEEEFKYHLKMIKNRCKKGKK